MASQSAARDDESLLSIIIINHNTGALLRRALVATALAAVAVPHEIIVVDNGSTDGSQAMLRTEFPDVQLIANADNRGFAGANNQAMAVARGDCLLLLNSDAAPEPPAIQAMLAALRARPAAAIVGPRLLNADGSPQSSRRRFPTLTTLFIESTHLAQLPLLRWVSRRFEYADRDDGAPQAVDWLVGACLLVRQAAVDAVGPFDPAFFFTAEEVEWQWRLRRAGWEVWYEPTARVLHDGGASSTALSPSRHIAFQAARVLLAQRLYGRLAGETLRAWYLALDGLQLLLEAAKLALRHKPALRRQRVALYAAVLRSGLAMPGGGNGR